MRGCGGRSVTTSGTTATQRSCAECWDIPGKMPKDCAVKSTAKAVHRYGWTMLSVLGPRAISSTVNTSDGETITVTITKMPQCSVILAEPERQ